MQVYIFPWGDVSVTGPSAYDEKRPETYVSGHTKTESDLIGSTSAMSNGLLR